MLCVWSGSPFIQKICKNNPKYYDYKLHKNIYHTILTMNVDELIHKLKIIEEENKRLQDELIQTKEHLKKYTAPASRKLYYENNKEHILEKMKVNPTPAEKRKEYNKKTYLRRKEKLKKEMEEKQNTENI